MYYSRQPGLCSTKTKTKSNISYLSSSGMLFWWPRDSGVLLGFVEILQRWLSRTRSILFNSSQLDIARGRREGVQKRNDFTTASFKKKVLIIVIDTKKKKNETKKHKWIPFDGCFHAPTPSGEEERPPDHFPAKCGE